MSVEQRPYAYLTFYLRIKGVETNLIGKALLYLTEDQWKTMLGKKGQYIYDSLNEKIKHEPWYGNHEIDIYSYYSEMLTTNYTFQWKKFMGDNPNEWDIYINDFTGVYKCKQFFK
jgi:hypothetical protein